MRFAEFDSGAFLRDSWQREALLIRDPWQAWRNPLGPDELAGLACEDTVESRLVIHDGDRWALEHGPFAEDRFATLAEAPWTLLVQAVDHHVPGVADLIAPFRFVPDWRIDDVMVSYAVDGGGVGAHFDQYDVFLIQGLGTRRWEVGAACDEGTALLPHDGLRLLADFEPAREWVLEPGDILYVPPGLAHRGTAIGDDCMTYSVGFRAPSHRELIEGYVDHLLANVTEGDRYTDAPPFAQANPGEITGAELARLQAAVASRLSDPREFARWFGEYSTAPKNPDIDWRPDIVADAAAVRAALRAGAAILRNPASRFAFVREGEEMVLLFVDGRRHECTGGTARFAEALCAGQTIAAPMDDRGAMALLEKLIAAGSIALAH